MAIYIQIRKVEETESEVVYAFGSSEALVGKILLHKHSGSTKLLEIATPDRAQFYLSRVERVLIRNHERGEYPQETCYAA